MLAENSGVKGSPEDKQASAPCIKGSVKIFWRVSMVLYTGIVKCLLCVKNQSVSVYVYVNIYAANIYDIKS